MNRDAQSLLQSITDIPDMPVPRFHGLLSVGNDLLLYWHRIWEGQVNAVRRGKNSVLARPPHSIATSAELW